MRTRFLSVLFLLVFLPLMLNAQTERRAVSLVSAGYYDNSIGTYAELGFAWGDGVTTSTGGLSKPLLFDDVLYDAWQGLAKCLQTKSFVIDKASLSVTFDVAYRFLVEARRKANEPMNQGLVSLDFELYDVITGEVHPRSSSLLEAYSIDVPPGQNCDESKVGHISIDIDSEWVSSGPREVVLRAVFHVSPARLMVNPSLSVVESVADCNLSLD